jgi:NADPH-dependent glutamate synthase beta subunit-like oxidoreductase
VATPQTPDTTVIEPLLALTQRYNGPSTEQVLARLQQPDMQDIKGVVSWRGAYLTDEACPVEMALAYLRLLQQESCGRCGPCRIGVDILIEQIDLLVKGKAQTVGGEDPVARIRRLAESIDESAWCGIGNTIGPPLVALLDLAPEHFQAHAEGQTCEPSTKHGWVTAPCRSTCPSTLDIPWYIFHGLEEHPHLATRIIKRDNPLPAIIGRTCPHPCESNCSLAPIGQPIAINNIKRWCADRAEDLASDHCASGCLLNPTKGAGTEGNVSKSVLVDSAALIEGGPHEITELTTAQPGHWPLGSPIAEGIGAPTDGTGPSEAAGDGAHVDEPVPEGGISAGGGPLVGAGAPKGAPKKKVAIIGAGPAGLSAGYYLARLGYAPTIFEDLPVPGGMVHVGIPEYRLPRHVIHRETELIQQQGVEIRYNTRLGRDVQFDDLEKEGFQATFVAIGAHVGRPLGIPGEDLPGAMDAIVFLRKVALGEKVEIGDSVLVLGGGNSAMDAARTSVRLGAKKVQVVYRRTRNEMPANAWEIEEAEEEGVEFLYLAAPVECKGEDGVEGLVCQQMMLGEPDASGRRRPVPTDMAPFVLTASSIIYAVGQQPDFNPFKDDQIKLNKWGYMEVDPYTLQTTKPGVFVGGDAVSGGGTIIEAINAGKTAAKYIDRYLRGEPVEEDIEDKTKRLAVYLGAQDSREPLAPEVDYGRRVPMPMVPAEVRKHNFEPTELGYSLEQVREEADRCLRCHRPILVAV